jgi:hypothetical protein
MIFQNFTPNVYNFRLLARPHCQLCKLFNLILPMTFLHDIRLTRYGIWPVNIIQAVVSELWYVEEYDLLALALDGRMKVRRFQLGCS